MSDQAVAYVAAAIMALPFIIVVIAILWEKFYAETMR